MNDGAAIIPTAAGPLRLRAESPSDAAFLAELFAIRAAPMLHLAGLAEPQVTQLVAIQHRAQTASYRSAFPGACFLVAELDDAPVGRLIVDEECGVAYVVDIALLPAWRGRGLGPALITDLQRRQGAAGGRVRAEVAVDNAASLTMFAKLGFVRMASDSITDVAFLWTPVET